MGHRKEKEVVLKHFRQGYIFLTGSVFQRKYVRGYNFGISRKARTLRRPTLLRDISLWFSSLNFFFDVESTEHYVSILTTQIIEKYLQQLVFAISGVFFRKIVTL